MIAYITTTYEPTLDICEWALERLGFEVKLVSGTTSLWAKLNVIYQDVTESFLRVDADVIVNKNVLELIEQDNLWWYQSLTFDWYKQDIGYGGIQFIRSEAIPMIKKHIMEAQRLERPETYLSRLEEFYSPRRFGNFDKICGLNGYRQNDYKRVKQTKLRRDQYDNYDWELAERLDAVA